MQDMHAGRDLSIFTPPSHPVGLPVITCSADNAVSAA
jgi:hypothetical protein